jgi:8-oxo-dGTP diphosphatase
MAEQMSHHLQSESDVSMSKPAEGRFAGQPPASQLVRSTTARLRFGAKALVRSRGRVMLIRERRTDGSTFWTLPGGGIEPGETPRESLARELREEIAVGCHPGAAVASCRYQHTSRPNTTTLYSVYETALEGRPTPNPAEGVVDYQWSLPGAVPGGTLDPFERLLEP